jgi:hypothetical protein
MEVTVENIVDAPARWEMERDIDVPGNRLGEFFREPCHPITRAHFAQRIADDEDATGRDPFRQAREQRGLLRVREVMQDIEERDVTAKIRQLRVDVLKAEFDVAVPLGGDGGAAFDLARVQVEAKDRLKAGAFPQIKGEQSHPATDVEDRLGGTA